MVSSAAENSLSALLRDTERRSGHQFVVALFNSLEGESLETYSNTLFKHWRVGDAQKNDGVLLALFKDDRKWRVEVGYGLEAVLTDLEAAGMARAGVPHFKQGDFDQGVRLVTELISKRLTGEVPRPPASSAEAEFSLDEIAVLIFLLFCMFLIFIDRTRGAWSSGGRSYASSDWSSSSDSSWGSSDSGGGYSGGGGSSGGGGASGGW